MQSNVFFERALAISVGSLSPTINWKTLAVQEFDLPPLHEQRRIAEVLWAVEEMTREYYQCLSDLDTAEAYVFGKALTDYQVEHVPLGKVATIDYGISAAVSANRTADVSYRILTNANITLNGDFDLSKESYINPRDKRFILDKGDILMVWRSGSPEHVGKAAIFDQEGIFVFASFLLRMKPGPLILNRYLWRLLNHMRRTGGFTRDTSQQVNFKMNASVFREVEIALPSIKNQQIIVQTLSEIADAKSKVARPLKLLRGLKDGLFGTLIRA